MSRLTIEACRALSPGHFLKDHVVRGLQLRATATGKSWMVYHRAGGVQRRPVIGYFPALTIELARDAARALLAEVARGGDPSGDKQKGRHAPTVADLARVYIESRARKNKPRTMEEIERHCRYIVDALGRKAVANIGVADVQRVLEFVTARKGVMNKRLDGGLIGPAVATVAANRVRETFRGMLNHAETSGLQWRPANSNPVGETPKNRERRRKVVAQPAQFPAIAAALERVALQWPERVAALWCILLAGTRVTELVSADRDEWAGDRITLAEHKTDRTGEDRVIYLPRQAQELLAELPRYPSGRLFGDIDRYNVYHAWELARDIAGCPGLTVRDFRRTFASVALSRGATLHQIGELFSHGDVATTAGYSWLLDADASALAQRTADEMERMTLAKSK